MKTYAVPPFFCLNGKVSVIIQRITFAKLENDIIVFQLISGQLIDLCVAILITIVYTFICIIVKPRFIYFISRFNMGCRICKGDGLIIARKLIMTIVILIITLGCNTVFLSLRSDGRHWYNSCAETVCHPCENVLLRHIHKAVQIPPEKKVR